MSVRRRYFLSAAAGLWLALPLMGQEPTRLHLQPVQVVSPASANQQLADRVAQELRQSTRLRHYDIDIAAQDGAIELTGTVTDEGQRLELHRTVRTVAQVQSIIDKVTLTGNVTQVQAVVPVRRQEIAPVAMRGGAQFQGMPEPMPIGESPFAGSHDQAQPHMPPYAWPTYAPYNNYSRVAYPEAYPYQAWPFIGPCYPFPKVPPGWRSVKLQWEDGHWWYSKTATQHDWWRVRYW